MVCLHMKYRMWNLLFVFWACLIMAYNYFYTYSLLFTRMLFMNNDYSCIANCVTIEYNILRKSKEKIDAI